MATRRDELRRQWTELAPAWIKEAREGRNQRAVACWIRCDLPVVAGVEMQRESNNTSFSTTTSMRANATGR